MNKDHLAKEFGPKLRAVRLRSGAALKNVASQLHIDPSLVSRWESGKAFPARREYVEFYARDLAGGEELLALYDKLSSQKANQATDTGLDIVVERLEIEYSFPPEAGMAGNRVEQRRLRALKPDLAYWELTYTYEDPSPDPAPDISISGDVGLELVYVVPVEDRPDPTFSARHRVIFPEPLALGQTAAFGINRRFRSDFAATTKPGFLGFQQITPRVFIEYLTIAIRFPNGMTPTSIWHYRLDRQMAPGSPELGEPLSTNKFGRAWHEWAMLGPGEACGIGWVW